MKQVFIYDLSDPRTGLVRYVGKSVNPKERLATHVREARQGNILHSRRWIDGLLQARLKPVLGIIEVATIDTANECERFWISMLGALGFDLTNRTPGGDGQSPGYKPSAGTIEKNRRGSTGKKRTPEQRAMMSEAFRRPEVAEKRRELMLQRYADPIAAAKITGPTKGMRLSDETKRKMSEAWTEERKAKHAAEKSALPVDGRWHSQLEAARQARWEKYRKAKNAC